MTEELYDVIIIGGGPAGLSAAQYASRANLKTVILDKSSTAGALAYAGKIENYPGLTNPVSGKELLDIFRNQAIQFGAEYIQAQVVGVKLEGETKDVSALDRTYHGRTVIIATGSMGRKPSIPGEEKFLGRGVSYCAICDAAFFRDQEVCVLGDSEEALKEANLLTGFAKTVHLIAPSEELKVTADHAVLSSPKLRILKNHRVTSIDGDGVVTRISVRNMATKEVQEMPMDGVFVYLFGSQPVVEFLNSTVPLGEKTCITTHRTMETSIPGVYAAGDVTCAEVRQVVLAAAYGCIAALSAEKHIRHRKRVRPDWAKS